MTDCKRTVSQCARPGLYWCAVPLRSGLCRVQVSNACRSHRPGLFTESINLVQANNWTGIPTYQFTRSETTGQDLMTQRVSGGLRVCWARRTYQAGQNEPVICFVLDPLDSAAGKPQGDSDGGEGEACCVYSNHARHAVVIDVVLLITDLSRREHRSHGNRFDLPSSCWRIVVNHQKIRLHEDGIIVSQTPWLLEKDWRELWTEGSCGPRAVFR